MYMYRVKYDVDSATYNTAHRKTVVSFYFCDALNVSVRKISSFVDLIFVIHVNDIAAMQLNPHKNKNKRIRPNRPV